MKFRTAEINDLKTLNTISVKSKSYWGYPESWIEKWLDELTLDEDKFSKQNVLIIEFEQNLIGFASIVENNENYEILHLWILPEYIGKGFGKKLLEKTIQTFVKSDKEVIVEADPNAEPFYQSQGFITYDKIESFPKGRFLPVMKRDYLRTGTRPVQPVPIISSGYGGVHQWDTCGKSLTVGNLPTVGYSIVLWCFSLSSVDPRLTRLTFFSVTFVHSIMSWSKITTLFPSGCNELLNLIPLAPVKIFMNSHIN
jgi:GNAT superfamily N-acetyltransferase